MLTSFPAQFGRYTIIRKIAEGGMGEVYLALDTQLDRRVALKIPCLSNDVDREAAERFIR